MKLCIKDRFVLMNILPSQGSFTDIKLLVELRQRLPLTEEEIKLYEYYEKDGQSHWSDDLEKEHGYGDVEIGPRATSLIHEALAKLDREKKLTPLMIGLYETFVEDKTG